MLNHSLGNTSIITESNNNTIRMENNLNKNTYNIDLMDSIKQQKEWSKAIIFDQEGKLLAATDPPLPVEIDNFLGLYNDRDQTITSGILYLNEQYDVHRFHPPLIYGRRGNCLKGEGEGIAICKVTNQVSDKTLYCLITYVLPVVSARAVHQLLQFCQENCIK